MTPKYIFCQCMKPWKLCINKSVSHRVDVRGLIDVYKIRDPFLSDDKREQLRDSFYNSSKNINYDFINMRPTNTKFKCRFLDKK
jgi:hypothetical protein